MTRRVVNGRTVRIRPWNIRFMQDSDDQWKVFQRKQSGAVSVIPALIGQSFPTRRAAEQAYCESVVMEWAYAESEAIREKHEINNERLRVQSHRIDGALRQLKTSDQEIEYLWTIVRNQQKQLEALEKVTKWACFPSWFRMMKRLHDGVEDFWRYVMKFPERTSKLTAISTEVSFSEIQNQRIIMRHDASKRAA